VDHHSEELAVFWTLVSLSLTAAAGPHVVSTFGGAEFARFGIIADLVERPAGISDGLFAQQLIDAEGLRPWNGKQLDSPPMSGSMGTKAVFSGDGREVIVKYVAGDVRRAGRVCRLRFARGGWSTARWNAYRWCASAFGLSLPDAPPPPIATTVIQDR